MTVESELAGIGPGDLVLVVTPASRYQKTVADVARAMSGKDRRPAIYLTANLPHRRLIDIFREQDVDTDEFLFIDTVSKESRSDAAPNALVLETPEDLTGISIALTNAVDAIAPTRPHLIVDSLPTLAMYSSPRRITEFVHYLTARMREWDLNGIILTVSEDTDPAMLSRITQMVDRVIEV